MKLFVILGTVLGFLSVAFGAFGAHKLKGSVDPKMLDVWETGARYQMYHALALFGVAWVLQQTQHAAATVAGWAFLVGVVLFSGSLYLMVVTELKWLGPVTPLGGLALLVGWASLGLAAFKGL